MAPKTALVLRPTGNQGRAVLNHLLAHEWDVHALVPSATTSRALALSAASPRIKLFEGTLADPNSLVSALEYCTAIFLVQMPSFTDDAETRDAASLLDLAKQAGVKHIVHSTTLPLNDANVHTTMAKSIVAPAVLPKGDVEDLVRGSGIPWTIIRPGFFMTNLVRAPVCYFSELQDGKFVTSFTPETILPLVDLDDIGTFVAAAMDNPARFGGKIVTVVSERLGIDEIADEIGRASGKRVEAVYRTEEEIAALADDPMKAGQILSRDLDKYVDMDEVKSWKIPLTSFRTFLEKNRDAVVPSAD